MKFQELVINDKFTIEGNISQYTKTVARGQSCCTPPHNTFYTKPDGGRGVELIADDTEVTKVE